MMGTHSCGHTFWNDPDWDSEIAERYPRIPCEDCGPEGRARRRGQAAADQEDDEIFALAAARKAGTAAPLVRRAISEEEEQAMGDLYMDASGKVRWSR